MDVEPAVALPKPDDTNKPSDDILAPDMSELVKAEGLEGISAECCPAATPIAAYMLPADLASKPGVPVEASSAYSELHTAHEAALQQLALLQYVGASGHILTNAILLKFAMLSQENESLAKQIRDCREMLASRVHAAEQAKDAIEAKAIALSETHVLLKAQEDELERLTKLLQEKEESTSSRRESTHSSRHEHRRSKTGESVKVDLENGHNGVSDKADRTSRRRDDRSRSRDRGSSRRDSDRHRHHSRRSSRAERTKKEESQGNGTVPDEEVTDDAEQSRRHASSKHEERASRRSRRSRSRSRSASAGRQHRSRSRSPVRKASRHHNEETKYMPEDAVRDESPIPTAINHKGRINPLLQPPPKTIQIAGAAPPSIDTPKPSRATLMGRLGLPVDASKSKSQNGIGIIGRAAGRGRGSGIPPAV